MRSPMICAILMTVVSVSSASAASPRSAQIGDAVTRSLTLLQKAEPTFASKALCASCHHQVQPMAAARLAQSKGLVVDDVVVARQLRSIQAELEGRSERGRLHAFQPGTHTALSGIMGGAVVGMLPLSDATDAAVIYLMGKQTPAGNWDSIVVRAPVGGTDFTSTAAAVRAIQTYAPPALRGEADRRISHARAWLVANHGDVNEALVHRLNGLAWARAPARDIRAARIDLLRAQGSDGGWAQQPGMDPDPFATAQSLLALAEGGMSSGDPAYQRGVDYLLRHQKPDGSWFVKSRALPIQPAIDGGFPYGQDQWISAMATGLAATALANALP